LPGLAFCVQSPRDSAWVGCLAGEHEVVVEGAVLLEKAAEGFVCVHLVDVDRGSAFVESYYVADGAEAVVEVEMDGPVLPGFVAGGEQLFVCVDAGFNHIAISVKLCQYYGQITGNVNNIFVCCRVFTDGCLLPYSVAIGVVSEICRSGASLGVVILMGTLQRRLEDNM